MLQNKNDELEPRLERLEATLSVRSSQLNGGAI